MQVCDAKKIEKSRHIETGLSKLKESAGLGLYLS